MKTKISVALAIYVVGAFLAAGAVGQDAASLEAAVRDYYDKLNDEDASSVDYFLEDAEQFPRTGLILTPLVTDEAATREQIDGGLDFEVELHHLSGKVFGEAGIATYYTTGTTTYPDGVVLRGTFRATAVAVWQGRQWRIAHFHLSELKTVPE